MQLTEANRIEDTNEMQQLSVVKADTSLRLEKKVWNAFIQTLYGFRLNSTITFVTLLAPLDYRSVTEAKS